MCEHGHIAQMLENLRLKPSILFIHRPYVFDVATSVLFRSIHTSQNNFLFHLSSISTHMLCHWFSNGKLKAWGHHLIALAMCTKEVPHQLIPSMTQCPVLHPLVELSRRGDVGGWNGWRGTREALPTMGTKSIPSAPLHHHPPPASPPSTPCITFHLYMQVTKARWCESSHIKWLHQSRFS